MNLIEWFKKLRFIVRTHDDNQLSLLKAFSAVGDDVFAINKKLSLLANEVEALRKVVKERTVLSASINYKAPSYAVLIGKYRGVDYVETFELCQGDFTEIVDRIRQIEKYAMHGRIDAPLGMKAVFQKEGF